MKFNKVCFALLMLLAIASQSCMDMNDLTDKYLDEGEIVYAAKAGFAQPDRPYEADSRRRPHQGKKVADD